ncbi:MAG: FUSC family protein [Pseudomonadota bacterium]
MAPPASVEAPRGIFRDIAQLLAPSPGRLEFALRLALICALTTLVAEIYHTPEPALTTYVVFFVNKPDRAESTIVAIAFMIIISIVIGLVLLLAIFVINEPMQRVAAMAGISLVLLFLASASRLKPLAGIIALIVAYALDLLGSAPVSELVTRALLYAWLFVGIPASVSLVVNFLMAPAPRRLAERALAERLERAAELLEAPSMRTRAAFAESLNEGLKEIDAWLKLAGIEHTSARADIAALKQAAAATGEILPLVDIIDRDAQTTFPPSLRAHIAETLGEMAEILRAGGYPIDITLDAADEASLSPLDATIFARLKAAIVRFCEAPQEPAPAAPKKEKSGFFLPDAFTNQDHVRYALKTTGAAMFCYMVYSQLDWSGIHTALITCYIVSLGTAAETIEKLTLRILGCLIGAAIGIATLVFVIPQLSTIGGLMIVVFLGALAAAWIAAGSPRIAYVGFQFAFAFFLCVIQGTKPGFDMVVARDRVIGILLGNFVVYLLFTNVWPVSVGARIDAAMAALLRQMSALAVATNIAARRKLATQVQTDIGALNVNLELVHYEPESVRPASAWIETRRHAAAEIAALEAPMLLSSGSEAELAAHRLDALADALDPQGRQIAPERPIPAGDSIPLGLRDIVDARLTNLERVLSPRSSVQEIVADAPA